MRSKPSPSSSTKSRTDAGCHDIELQPYQIQKPPTVSLATRVGHVFSSPNLRLDVSDAKGRPFRRSQSFTSMGIPQVSPLSPLSPFRLPSLTDHDQNGVPWAEAINESLRLSQFPSPPGRERSQILFPLDNAKHTTQLVHQNPGADSCAFPKALPSKVTATVRPVEIRVQQPTSVASACPSASICGTFRENTRPLKLEGIEQGGFEQEDDPRHSVHLHSMRISHHLRSGSLLSWEQLADAPEIPHPLPVHRGRTVSDQSRVSHVKKPTPRHERHTSSSGFASSKVPLRWGKVLPVDHDVRVDVASSIYSSRPQSPPESFVASLTSLGRTGTVYDGFNDTSIYVPRSRRSNSFPTDNEETPRAAPRHEPSNLRALQGEPTTSSSLATPTSLARKNSVADTKKSKFREEFSPSPPKKKIPPSESIVKFLNLKRLSGRSQSEASLASDSPIRSGDAAYDTLDVPSSRERRQSQSMISLQTEQKALGKFQGSDHVWDQALKAHQEEKACLFLPKNRDLAVHASPFRERSGSIMTRHSANEGSIPATPNASEVQNPSGNSGPSLVPKAYLPEEQHRPRLVSRRSAVANPEAGIFNREVSVIFDRQGDSPDIVGAWGRYPSHTRDERTNSAGKVDRVESRDFALEAAIRFASAQDIDEDMIDPTDRIPSMPLLPGEERKKKVGSGRMTKSNSMKFGKRFLKNYSNIFKSSSTEFRKHGRNHRSSITTGGVLEFPELELLPEVGKRRSSVQGAGSQSHRREPSAVWRRISDGQPADKVLALDSMATLRPRRNSSAPNLNEIAYDGASDGRHPKDNARVWSVYYDDCVPSYPRASAEVTAGVEDFCPARFSFESRQPSMRSRTMPSHRARHSRNTSRISYTSVMSRGSARVGSKFKDDDDDFLEKGSMISVRHSTMDLISKFKEQEIIEHERVLSMTSTGSRYEREALAAL